MTTLHFQSFSHRQDANFTYSISYLHPTTETLCIKEFKSRQLTYYEHHLEVKNWTMECKRKLDRPNPWGILIGGGREAVEPSTKYLNT